MRASSGPKTKAETWLAINPTNPSNVVIAAKDMNPESSASCVWNGVFVTHDGGASWKDVVIGGKFASRQPPSPFYGYACNTDPMFQFTSDGVVHYGVELYSVGGAPSRAVPDPTGFGPAGWKVLLASSDDGGDSWPLVIDFHPDLVTPTDYSRMAVSPKSGTILEAINNIGTASTCHVLASRDGGKTAAPPVKVIVREAPGVQFCRGLAVSPHGVVVVGFKDGLLEGPNARTFFARSLDDGKTFPETNEGWSFTPVPEMFEEVEAAARGGQQFELKYDLRTGTLWAITAEYDGGNADVFVRHSLDDGATWSPKVLVNEPNENHQWMPQIAFPRDGSLHAFYYDKQHDPENKLIDITHSVSFDQGASWSSERVTTVSWDGDLGRHQDGYPWIGDYIGADAVGDDVWFAVPDTSLGGEPVIAAGHVRRG